MQLLVLASGRGSRLNKQTSDKPKCFAVVKKKTIIERIIKITKNFNFKKIIILTGYKSHYFKKLNLSDKFKLIKNKEYSSSNMVHSMFKASRHVNSDLIVIYSDIIFDKKIINKMLKINKTHMPLKSNWEKIWKLRMSRKDLLADAESIQIENKNIIEIGGKIVKKLPKYQYMGMIRFNKIDFFNLKIFYKKINNKKIDMTSFINSAIQNKIIKMNFFETKKAWFEIDTEKDIKSFENLK